MYFYIGGGILLALLVGAFFWFLTSARNKKLLAQNTLGLEEPQNDGTLLQIAQDTVMNSPVVAQVKEAADTVMNSPVVAQVKEAAEAAGVTMPTTTTPWGKTEMSTTTTPWGVLPQVPQASFGQPRVL